MKYMGVFSEKRIFNFSFVVEETGSKSLASETIQNYLKNGLIKRIKKKLYATVSLGNEGVIPTWFEIASNITKDAFISHYSAFRFYEYYNQVSNEVTVSTTKQFRDFSFDYRTYRYKYTSQTSFIDEVNGARVASIERTMVDCVNDLKSYDDFEDLINNLQMIPKISGEDIYEYLVLINKKVLFNKVGLL